MQRLDWPSTSSETTLEHPRSSRSPSTTMLVTMSTVAALTASLMDNNADLEPIPSQSFRMIPVEYDEEEPVQLHSGPFNIEGCDYTVSFLDDGFTLMAGKERLRMKNVQAYFSNLSLENVHALLGDTGGVTEIECGDALVMRSGKKRSLEIPMKEVIRIIETAREERGRTITIARIPYKLEIEGGLSTCLIPRHGSCTIDFDILSKKMGTLLAADTH